MDQITVTLPRNGGCLSCGYEFNWYHRYCPSCGWDVRNYTGAPVDSFR